MALLESYFYILDRIVSYGVYTVIASLGLLNSTKHFRPWIYPWNHLFGLVLSPLPPFLFLLFLCIQPVQFQWMKMSLSIYMLVTQLECLVELSRCQAHRFFACVDSLFIFYTKVHTNAIVILLGLRALSIRALWKTVFKIDGTEVNKDQRFTFLNHTPDTLLTTYLHICRCKKGETELCFLEPFEQIPRDQEKTGVYSTTTTTNENYNYDESTFFFFFPENRWH